MPDDRGQLNIDVGKAHKAAFKKYCKRKKITMVNCLKQLIDYCTEGAKS